MGTQKLVSIGIGVHKLRIDDRQCGEKNQFEQTAKSVLN